MAAPIVEPFAVQYQKFRRKDLSELLLTPADRQLLANDINSKKRSARTISNAYNLPLKNLQRYARMARNGQSFKTVNG